MKKKDEISLKDLWFALRSHLILILLVTVLFAGGMYGYTKMFVAKQYAATVKLYAISNLDREEASYISVSEQNASRRLVETYIVVLKSDVLLGKVSERLADEYDMKVTAGEIVGCITASSINETEVFSVTITHTDPKKARAIANALADVAETEISEILGAGGVSVIDYAKLPVSPIAPKAKNQGILGGAIGFVLSCIVVLIRSLTDTTIWTQDDLTKRYETPLLGAIPRLGSQTSGKERSGT